MTKILILGGGGMLGQKLAKQLGKKVLADKSKIEITLFDIAFPAKPLQGVKQITGN